MTTVAAIADAPPSRGFLPALRSLLSPPRFRAVAPTFASVRYRARAPALEGRGFRPLADVYLPSATPRPLPSVLLVHGGAFLIGSRRMKPVRFLATQLVEAGFAVAAIDYRLLFRGGDLARAERDVADAFAWWRGAAARYGLDPARTSIAGISAGATLALLHAARAPEVRRAVAVFGPTDFTAIEGRLARFLRARLLGTSDRAAWAARSPLALATGAAPILLVHGTADVMVPVAHARALADMRRARGLPVETLLLEGEPHAFLNDATRPAAKRAVAAIVRFLAEGARDRAAKSAGGTST